MSLVKVNQREKHMLLKGDKNQCPSCSEYFKSTFAFDKHRVGKAGVDRKCLTPGEMEGKKMAKGNDLFWVSQRYPKELCA